MSHKQLAVTFLSILLSACGGGSSGDPSSPATSTATFPIATALSNISINGFSAPFNVSGKLNGITMGGSGTISSSPATASTFEGQQALMSITTASATLTSSQGSTSYGNSVQGYTDTDYRPLGADTGSEYWVVQGSASYPDTVKVGDTGIIGTINRYSDNTKASLLGTVRESYLIETDTPTTAIANIISNQYDTSNTEISSAQTRYRIDQNGSITWLSVTYTYLTGSSTGTLTFTRK